MSDLFYEDKWTSKILGKKSYISLHQENFDHNEIKRFQDRLEENSFLTLKVKTNKIKDIVLLQKCNFFIIDTLIKYSGLINDILKKTIIKRSNKNFFIEKGLEKDKEEIAKLARNEFKFSRFHLDPFILDSLGSRIKYDWVLNFFKGNRGDKLFIARDNYNSKIIGFILIIENKLPNFNSISIDLIASDSVFKNQGIASELVNYSASQLRDYQKINVGTQAVNIPANNLYQKLGFKIEDSFYVFHYHHKS